MIFSNFYYFLKKYVYIRFQSQLEVFKNPIRSLLKLLLKIYVYINLSKIFKSN